MDVDAIVEKIKSCVRLANRTTEEGERETALRLARGLAEKNGIAFDDIEASESAAAKATVVSDGDYRCSGGCEVGYAYFILHEHFGVIVMETPLRNNREKRRKTWIGSPLNIGIARHVLHVLLRECRRAYDEERKRPDAAELELRALMERWGYPKSDMDREVAALKRKKVVRRDFMRGFFYAIDRKLAERPLRNDIAADRKEAERKYEEYKAGHSVTEKKAGNGGDVSAENFAAGLAAAETVNLSRPCEHGGTSPLALANA